MSRSGYSDDGDCIAVWRGQVASATRGKRGQKLLRDLLAALDAMPEKSLTKSELEADGEVCALGALGKVRQIDLSKIDPENTYAVADAFGVARQLTCEIMYENDEVGHWQERPEDRWTRMRRWVAEQIVPTPEECNAVELPPESENEHQA